MDSPRHNQITTPSDKIDLLSSDPYFVVHFLNSSHLAHGSHLIHSSHLAHHSADEVNRSGTYWLEDMKGRVLPHPWNAEHLKKY